MKWYSVLDNGKWTTIRTNNDHVGAYRHALGSQARKIETCFRIGPRHWEINGAQVYELYSHNVSAG
jgi:hypothetical protein